MEKKNIGKSLLCLVLIFAVGAGLLTGINAVAGDAIERNLSSLALASLATVMPEGKGFEQVEIAGLPETVAAVYQETSGQGYAMKLSTTAGYTGEPMDFTIGVSADGIITGAVVDSYPDSKDFGQDTYPATFIGKDSALADVGLVAGVTYSSSAFKNAVSDGLTALIANGLIKEGVKGDDQILTELIPALIPGMANATGIAQIEEIEAADPFVKVFKSLNEGLMGYIAKDGDASYLVAVNTCGNVAAFDVEGNEVSAPAAILDAAKADAAGRISSFAAGDEKKLLAIAPEGAEAEEITDFAVFNSVTDAFKLTSGEDTFYGFVCRPYGYSNIPMVYYYIIDSDGAITAMKADSFILEGEYFKSYTLDENAYKGAFVGVTGASYTEDMATISGATFSSQATATATADAFAAFDAVKGGA